MNPLAHTKNLFFNSFGVLNTDYSIPLKFDLMVNSEPHPLCLLAAEKLQMYLQGQNEWKHNFGLEKDQSGSVIGKMFGVLIVQTLQNEIGYLAAFSGKLAGENHHLKFVPPVFDSLDEKSFLNTGMIELGRINKEIADLEEEKPDTYLRKIEELKAERKKHSALLQQRLFDEYTFLNIAGQEKSLNTLFNNAGYKNPPSGAGECAGPKLLQYAFQNNMKPLAMAEFWWGLSPKSETWKHKHFYACCKEKCEPILVHMLEGIN